MSKKSSGIINMNILRTVIIIGIIIYVFGIIPQLTEHAKILFANPIIKIGFLALIACVSYIDSGIAILLAIAFLVSYLQTPEHNSLLYKSIKSAQEGGSSIIAGTESGATHLIGGVGTGTQHLIGGIGSGASEVVSGVGRGTQKLIGGVGSGATELVGGVGKGATGVIKGFEGDIQKVTGKKSVIGQAVGGVSSGLTGLIGGIQSSAQNIISGVGGSAKDIVGGIQGGLEKGIQGVSDLGQYGVSGIQTGATKAISGLGSGAQQLIGGVKENMSIPPLSGKSISKEFQDMSTGQMSDKGCNVQPYMTTGCDSIVGYNAPIDCSGVQPNDTDSCLCSGVKVWKDEMGTQGLSAPQGFAGKQMGSTF